MEEKLKISDLNKLKFTSMPEKSGAIHFKYNDIDYHIYPNVNEEDWEQTFLNKGRMKNNEYREEIGYVDKFITKDELIKFKYNKRTLSSINKENFVKVLYKYGLIDTDINELRLEALNDKEKEIENEYQKQSDRINQEIKRLQVELQKFLNKKLEKEGKIQEERNNILKDIKEGKSFGEEENKILNKNS